MAGSLLSAGKSSRFSYRRPPVAEINITPFVDVMLVLLIVFMVSAPLMTQGVKIELPEVATMPLNESTEPVEVSIKRNGDIYIQTQKVNLNTLSTKLKAIKTAKPKAPIMLRADKSVRYGQVMAIMAQLQDAGLYDIGLITQPPEAVQ